MKILHSFLLHFIFLLAILKSCLAQIDITSPEAGDEIEVSDSEVTVSIKWDDDDDSPTMDEIATIKFVLCTGPNDDIQALADSGTITASEISGNSYKATFSANAAADGLFYIQLYAALSNGGHMTRYSGRFTIEGMTGSIEPSGTGSAPDGETDDGATTTDADADTSASFTVPYTKQTGKTRYAPMQMQPGTKITVSTWSRRFPSSAVTYYSTAAASPVVLSTVTPGWSYTMSSFINYATPAPFPSVVSWYAPSKRLASATLDSSASEKKRRMMKKRWAD